MIKAPVVLLMKVPVHRFILKLVLCGELPISGTSTPKASRHKWRVKRVRVSCKCCVEKRDVGVRLDIATQLDSLFFSLLVMEVHPSYFIRNNYVMILLRNGRKSIGQIQKPPLTNVVKKSSFPSG